MIKWAISWENQIRLKSACSAGWYGISNTVIRGIILFRQRKQRHWAERPDVHVALHLCSIVLMNRLIQTKSTVFQICRISIRPKDLFRLFEPRHEKTCLWGLQPGKIQTSLLSTSQGLEILDIASRCIILSRWRTTKTVIRLHGCAGWSAPLLFAYGKNRFSHDVAHFSWYGSNKVWSKSKQEFATCGNNLFHCEDSHNVVVSIILTER